MTPPAYLHFDAASRAVRLDPHADPFVQNPYDAYGFLHAHARIFFWEDYGFWCLAGFDDVNRLLRDKRFGRERPGGYVEHAASGGERSHLAAFDRVEAVSMLELEPPAHTRLRGLVNRAFVSRQVERLRPRVERLANDLIDGFEAQGAVDLLPAFAEPIPIVIIAEMLGVPPETGPQLLAWSHSMVAMYRHDVSRAMEVEANQASAEFSLFLREHAASRRRTPGDDLLSLLLAAQDAGGRLSEDELVASAILLLNAGHEATVHQIGNAVASILRQGPGAITLFATADGAAATVEECLRFDPPLHLFKRYAYEDAEIAPGVTIKAGERVGLLLGAANRDPLAFTDPHRFDPGRTDAKNVSFGAGIHFCIGAPLARLELQAALTVLFERLPTLRLAQEPRYRDVYHFHGLERLDATWA